MGEERADYEVKISKVEREKILQLVYASIEVINEQREDEKDRLELRESTRLFGRGSKLDSLDLVTLIVEIEQRLADKLCLEFSLTDERAMSQENSPFMSAKSLVDYISSLLKGGSNG